MLLSASTQAHREPVPITDPTEPRPSRSHRVPNPFIPGRHEGGHVQFQGKGHVRGDLPPQFGRVFESLQELGRQGKGEAVGSPPMGLLWTLPKAGFSFSGHIYSLQTQ